MTISARATSNEQQATVSDLSERELIARIQQLLPPAPPWLLVGIGDDAAIVEPERNRVEVLTVDAIVEGIHFDRAFVPPDAIGHRALAVNLSDLAAMGATPRLALLSMALPGALPLADFDAIAAGIAALAAAHRLHVVGGNLTRSPGPLMIDVTLIGTVKRRQGLTRGGAKPGDDLYVSGTIGGAAAGLGLLRKVVGHRFVADHVEPCVERRRRHRIVRVVRRHHRHAIDGVRSRFFLGEHFVEVAVAALRIQPQHHAGFAGACGIAGKYARAYAPPPVHLRGAAMHAADPRLGSAAQHSQAKGTSETLT